ncbi:MAG: hypothetical protein ACJAV2_001407 [Myxococcota bacterium]
MVGYKEARRLVIRENATAYNPGLLTRVLVANLDRTNGTELLTTTRLDKFEANPIGHVPLQVLARFTNRKLNTHHLL